MKRQVGLLLALVAASTVLIFIFTVTMPSTPTIADDFENFQYRFVREYEVFNVSDPTKNPVPSQVVWLEDLSHRVVCNTSNPFILAIVPSAITHFDRRRTIRKTWGDPKLFKYTRMRTIFILGKTLNASLQEEVIEEMNEFDDLIQYDFIDSYRNLTYKTISWVSWVNDWCLETPWIAKIDDDVVVNPFHLKTFLAKELKKNQSPAVIYGRFHPKNKALRTGKWNVTEEEYKLDFFPPFVLGPAYIVGRNAIPRLHMYAAHTPMLWLEDVYMTGIVAQVAGVGHVQAEKTLYTKKATRALYHDNGKTQLAFLLASSDRQRKSAWAAIERHSPLYKKRTTTTTNNNNKSKKKTKG